MGTALTNIAKVNWWDDKMQLTKDDLESLRTREGTYVSVIRLNRIQQCINFYEKHKIPSTGKGAYLSDFFDKMRNDKEHQELSKKHDEYLRRLEFTFIMPDASTDELRKKLIEAEFERITKPMIFNDWLFNHCFIEGLK